jgi:hypothetical protein
MNSDNQERFEIEIDRELRALPDLPAPSTLAPRVMAAIERRAAAPWFARSWPEWPVAARAASFLLLAALFGGLCYGGWHLGQLQFMHAAGSEIARGVSAVGALLGSARIIVAMFIHTVTALGTGVVLVALLATALAYALFLALAAGSYRLVLVASSESSYERIQN